MGASAFGAATPGGTEAALAAEPATVTEPMKGALQSSGGATASSTTVPVSNGGVPLNSTIGPSTQAPAESSGTESAAPIGQVQGAGSGAAAGRSGDSPTSPDAGSTSVANTVQPPAPASPAAPDYSAAAAAAAAASIAGQHPTAFVRPGSTVEVRSPADLAATADRLMNQVVQTVKSFQTSAGPALEARISDPNFGDVRMVVTGRAGEVVQAQLIVRDRAAADAITQAAARIHSTSDGLAGVSVTVRSESGTTTGGGRGGGFEAAGWSSGSGSGAGSAPGNGTGTGTGNGTGNAPGNGHGAANPGLGNQTSTATGGGSGSSDGGTRGLHVPSPVTGRPALVPTSDLPKGRVPGGPSLDIRA